MKKSSAVVFLVLIAFFGLDAIDIHDCISASLNNSTILHNEEYRLKNLEGAKAKAWLAFVPQASLYSSANYDIDGNQYGSAGITVSENIYLLDDRWSSLKLAGLDLDREQIEYKKLRNDLILETVQLYTNLLIQIKKIEYYQQAFLSYEQEINYIKELIPVGAKTELDLYSAEIELQNLQLDIDRTRNESDKIMLELNHKTDLDLERETDFSDIEPGSTGFDQVFDHEKHFNWQKQELTNLMMKVARKRNLLNLLPDLYLNGYYNWKYQKYWEDKAKLYDFEGNFISRDQEQDYWEVSLNLSFPLGSLSERLYDYKTSQRNYRIEMNNTFSLEQDLTRELQSKQSDLQLKQKELEIGRNKLDLTEKKLDLTRERYYSGLISFYDYNTAKSEFLSAQIALIETKYSYLIILAEYQNLSGGLLLEKY